MPRLYLPRVRALSELAGVNRTAPFLRTTYTLEGDGMFALSAYRQLQLFIRCKHYPNVNAVAKRVEVMKLINKQFVEYGKNCVRPAQAKSDATTGDLD